MFRFILVCLFFSVVLGSILPWNHGRIVGGKDTTIEKFPHQISFQYYDAHWCGGSILDDRTILTAAHCVEDLSAKSMSVLAGCTNNDKLCPGGQLVKVDRYIYHEKWNLGVKYDYDVALLKLKEPLKLNGKSMKAVKLPNWNDLPSTIKGKATASGWGSLKENGDDPEILQEVDVDMISHDECQSYFGSVRKITENMICAKTPGKDTCQGDSGGPLISNGQQIGIVSWGIGCARPSYPGVYTNVIQLKNWIMDNIDQ